MRQRQAEIASIRRELEEIAHDVHKLCREWPLLVRAELRKAGYDPDEPRVLAGYPDSGQWATEDNGKYEDTTNATVVMAARSKQSEAECDAQLAADGIICNALRSRSCWA